MPLLLGGFLVAVGLGVVLSLLAGDVRRRRVEMRRRWYERRLHTAMDRVQALKLEIEPPLDGIEGFAQAEVPKKKSTSSIPNTGSNGEDSSETIDESERTLA